MIFAICNLLHLTSQNSKINASQCEMINTDPINTVRSRGKVINNASVRYAGDARVKINSFFKKGGLFWT